MKTTKLITYGNYGTTFSAEEVVNVKKNHLLDDSNFTMTGDEDNLVYEISESELGLKNIVLNPSQRNIIDLILKERADLDKIKRFNLPATSKFLLYGPPGTGKTLSAYCIAGELGKKLFIVNLANLISSRLGETSKNIDKIFVKAKSEGAILFIDEFDAISRTRDSVNEHGEIKRTVNVLLQILDLVGEQTLVIGATNRLQDMDDAILRRFNYKIEYPMPSGEQVSLYLDFLQFSHNFKFKGKKIREKILNMLEGRSYADIQQFIVNILKRKIFSENSSLKTLTLNENDLLTVSNAGGI